MEFLGLVWNCIFVPVVFLVLLSRSWSIPGEWIIILAGIVLVGSIVYLSIRRSPATENGWAVAMLREYLTISGVFFLVSVVIGVILWWMLRQLVW
jgi:hypothetical protein